MASIVDRTYKQLEMYTSPGMRARVIREIAPRDGMFKLIRNDGSPRHGEEQHYFYVGASALLGIYESLHCASVNSDEVKNVLDYACGYGRVLRWLKAGFHEANLLGLDVDRKAVEAASKTLLVDCRLLDISLKAPIDRKFDVIWVGSLITHLPQSETTRILRFLRSYLSDRGVLVITTHGSLVLNRLLSGERLYGLNAKDVATVISLYKETGYGFASYPNQEGYGISVSRPGALYEIAENVGLEAFFFKAQGWASHQDLHAFRQETVW